MDESDLIKLTDDHGRPIDCRLLSVFQFRSQEYALLLHLHLEDTGVPNTVIMQLIQDGEGVTTFRTIKDDKEFQRVVAYVRELTNPNLAEGYDRGDP